MKTFPEEAAIAGLLAPAADAAGRSSVGINLKGGHKAYLVVYLDQENAATVALTPEQCTSSGGGSAKAIPASPIWATQDAAASSALTRQTDAASFTTDATLKKKIVVFEIDPAHLDGANGFSWVRISTGASNAANITSAVAVVVPVRYGSAAVPNVLA